MNNQKFQKFLKVSIKIFIGLIIFYNILEDFIAINLTPSIPAGVYFTYPARNIKIGDIVIFEIPEDIKEIIYEREYIFRNCHEFIKQVGALEGAKIENREGKLYIDGKEIGKIFPSDKAGRKFPQIENFEVSKNHFFPIGNHENSFDGRYYGEINKNKIRKKAKLLYKFQNK